MVAVAAKWLRPRVWSLCVLLSLLVHAPMSPLMALLKPAQGRQRPSTVSAPFLTEIPIDFGSETAPSPAPAAEPPNQPTPSEPTPNTEGAPVATRVRPPRPRAPKAAVAAASSAAPAVPEIASLDPALPKVDGAVLYVDLEKLHGQPLGPRTAALLAALYRWRDFFVQSKLDPLEDIDRVYLVASQLGRAADLAAVVQHRMSSERTQSALERLPPRVGSENTVRALGSTENDLARFILQPAPGLLLVCPETALASAKKFPLRTLPALAGSTIAWAHAVAPHRTLPGLELPESVLWAKAMLSLDADGAAIVDLEMEEKTAELAQKDADELAQRINALAELDLSEFPGLGRHEHLRTFGQVEFKATGSRIQGRVSITHDQTAALLDLVRGLLALQTNAVAWAPAKVSAAPVPTASTASPQ